MDLLHNANIFILTAKLIAVFFTKLIIDNIPIGVYYKACKWKYFICWYFINEIL